MDNITIRFEDVTFNKTKLKDFLAKRNARESAKPDEVILFIRPVGKHKIKWQFRLDLANKNILCSGGPTTTFFGFNAWVSLNSSAQMKAIVQILSQKLSEMDGVTLSAKVCPTIHRVEATHLFKFDSLEQIAQAEIALYSSLVARYPGKVMLSGASIEVPGMLRVGLNKSATTLRLYPEDNKLSPRPVHVSPDKWALLCAELKTCLRVECIFDSTQLKSAKLDKANAWNTSDCLSKLVDNRMHHAGLRGIQPQNYEGLMRRINEKKDWPASCLVERWESGEATPKNGTWSTSQALAKSMGFDLTLPFTHQKHLAHGFQDYFTQDKVLELSKELRSDPELFGRWWEASQAV